MQSHSMSSVSRSDAQAKAGVIRRRRLVLSCQVCKRRKVKCDRQSPVCQRCVDGGCTDRCTYDERLEMHDSSPPETRAPPTMWPDPPTNLFTSQQPQHSRLQTPAALQPGTQAETIFQRPSEVPFQEIRTDPIASRQSLLPITPASSTRTTTSLEESGPAESSQPRPLVQGAGFKTQFHGTSHSISIIRYFDGLHTFLKQTASDHPLLGASRWTGDEVAKSPSSESSAAPSSAELMERLLPREPVCRSLMQAYVKHFEGIYRIIHVPVFWRRYDAFWPGRTGKDPAFMALLLAAMSCARCLHLDDPLSFDGESSSARREAIRWEKAAEAWHDSQSHKHTTGEIYQIKCLLLLTKKINAIKVKRHYTLAQTLLASAISIGLHRSPNGLGNRASIYDKELRRRLWATITELELDDSIERGVPSLVNNLHTDAEPPGNLRDEDFDDGTSFEPLAQSPDVLTTSSCLRYSHSLRSLQHTINNLVNHPEEHKNLTSSDLNSHHERLFNALLDLRSWPKDPTDTGYSDGVFLGNVALQLKLHRLLIMLHLPFAMCKTPSITVSHSRMVCGASSKAVIEIYAHLSDRGFSQMCFTRMDLMRASLCLCLMECQATFHDAIYNPITQAHTSTNTALTLIEKSLAIFESRILSLGDGFRGLWLLFAASCFIPPHNNPNDPASAAWQEKVVNRVIVLCSKICLCQVSRGSNTGGEHTDQLFARYMKHIQRTPVFAKVDDSHHQNTATAGAGGETRGSANTSQQQDVVGFPSLANGERNPNMTDLRGLMKPLFDGFPTNDWLDPGLDDFGFSSWMES